MNARESVAAFSVQVLGIDEYEPLDEVNRAYKRLSLVYHPDKTKGMSSQQQQECPIQCFQLTECRLRPQAASSSHPCLPSKLMQDYETIFISVKNAHLVLGTHLRRFCEMVSICRSTMGIKSGTTPPSCLANEPKRANATRVREADHRSDRRIGGDQATRRQYDKDKSSQNKEHRRSRSSKMFQINVCVFFFFKGR